MNFQSHILTLNAKLKRANNLLATSRHYIPKALLLQIYYGQFFSHLTYGCQLWGQHLNPNSPTFVLQKKAVRLINFANYQAHTDPIFKELKILKVMDIIKMRNVLFVHNILNCNVPKHFDNFILIRNTKHSHRTINNPNSLFSIPQCSVLLPESKSKIGKQSIKYLCAITWNEILKSLSSACQKEGKTYKQHLDERNVN